MVLEADSGWARQDGASEVAEQLQEFARRIRGLTGPLEPRQVVAEAAAALPNAATAGLTLIRGSEPPRTLGATSELADRVDKIQYDTGEGPCLEAIKDNDITVTNDLTDDCRWPRFCARAVEETPVRSMFGVRVLLGAEDRGALNFYALDRHAFDDVDLAVGAIFATLASLALQSTIERQRAINLEVALESSRQIGMAMGILMSSRLLTADQAFDQLRKASQHLQRRVRDVAAEVMETGTLPEIPPRRRPNS